MSGFRRSIAWVVAGSVRLLALALLVWLATTPPSAASQGWGDCASWLQLNPLRPLGTTLAFSSLSCPTAKDCFVVGSDGVMITPDGGTTWRRRSIGLSAWPLTIDCPSPTACFVVGGDQVAASLDAGVTWRQQHLSTAAMRDLSCATTTTCLAVGDNGSTIFTEDAGATWVVGSIGTAAKLVGVSCPNSLRCFALTSSGEVFTTRDGGRSWQVVQSDTAPAVVMPQGRYSYFASLACPSETTCYVLASEVRPSDRVPTSYIPVVIKTTDGGAHWQEPRTLANILSLPTDISCSSITTCVASSMAYGTTGIVVTVDGWASWSRLTTRFPYSRQRGGITLVAAACPTTDACFTVADNGPVYASTDGGRAWSAKGFVATGNLRTIQCPTPATCFVAGLDGLLGRSTDAGATWQRLASLHDELTDYGSLSCPTAKRCIVAAQQNVFWTEDAGTTWNEVSLPSGDLSCPTELDCYAAAGTVLRTADGGLTWRQMSPRTLRYAQRIDCPTVATCIVLAGTPRSQAIIRTDDGGDTWSIQFDLLDLGLDGHLTDLDCATASHCVVVADVRDRSPGANRRSYNVVSTKDAGTTWQMLTMASPGPLTAIDCATELRCLLAGDGIVAESWNGGSAWTAVTGDFGKVLGLACPTEQTCFGVTDDGRILARSRPPMLDLNGALPGVDSEATFGAGGPPVAVLDSDGVADPDPCQLLNSVTLSIANPLDAPNEILSVDHAAISSTALVADLDPRAATLTISGADTIANYRRVLSTLRYANTAPAPDTLDRVITVVANDAALDSNVAVSRVRIRSSGTSRVDLVDFTAETDATGQVNLAWHTADEPGAAGFNLRRARWIGGAAVRVNSALIPAQAAVGGGARYSWQDQPGPGHFHYWLEAVDAVGQGDVLAGAAALVGSGQAFLPVALDTD